MALTNFSLASSNFPSLYKMHPSFTTISESSWFAISLAMYPDEAKPSRAVFHLVHNESAIGEESPFAGRLSHLSIGWLLVLAKDRHSCSDFGRGTVCTQWLKGRTWKVVSKLERSSRNPDSCSSSKREGTSICFWGKTVTRNWGG
jgi:hypothetical protein